MANTIYELTMEKLPDGVLHSAAEMRGGVLARARWNVLISLLRKCKADCVKIDGDSVISEH